jgi:hypothetical protein
MKIKINLIGALLCAIAITPSVVFAYAPIESETDAANVPMLAPVTVNASLEGPAMWRVSRDGHLMWVLGIVHVVPKKLTWQSHNIASVMVHAQELIKPPNSYFRVFFLKALLLNSAVRDASKNPGHATLTDVLPPSIFSRWRMLWRKYRNRSTSIEQYNPDYVARILYRRFLKSSGLRSNRSVVLEISNMAQKDNVSVVKPDYVMRIPHPKRYMIAGAKSGYDSRCFLATLDYVQRDLSKIMLRANAWATGDIDALRITKLVDRSSCNWEDLKVLRKYGAGNVPKRLRAIWLSAAESALEKNKVTIAILPMSELLEKNGYLAALRAQGYKVEPPSAR